MKNLQPHFILLPLTQRNSPMTEFTVQNRMRHREGERETGKERDNAQRDHDVKVLTVCISSHPRLNAPNYDRLLGVYIRRPVQWNDSTKRHIESGTDANKTMTLRFAIRVIRRQYFNCGFGRRLVQQQSTLDARNVDQTKVVATGAGSVYSS